MIRNRTTTDQAPQQTDPSGFTLLEMLVVLTIMGLLAAMVYPAMGYLNQRERERITRAQMAEIRRALVGDPDRFDETGQRIIGGYVGDMQAWPDLWEAAPQVRESVTGTPPDFDPEDASNPGVYYYRPSGRFVAKNWVWNLPFRRLTDAALNTDHIGGLETENEGQPLGLWTDDPSGDNTARLDPLRWKGPYLFTPTDNKPEDALHLAEEDGGYAALEPAYGVGPSETWEEGDYAPDDLDPGEHFDDKEQFRLMQTEGRLADGWDRAFRFFITTDPDHAGETLFWIVSEGADQEGTYPNKGTCAFTAWTVDATDKMGTKYDPTATDPRGYNPDDPYNQDNIVMKISSREWRAVFAAQNLHKRQQTEALFSSVRRALKGNSTAAEGGFNTGFTGALCRWPKLFRWEDNGTPADATDDFWDDENTTSTAYSKGQPRGLWTDQPNVDPTTGTDDNLAGPSLTISTGSGPGIGWQGPYLPPPLGTGVNERLVDAWGRELLFFLDTTNNLLLVLSRGPDGQFDFGDTDTLPVGAPDGTDDFLEPASPTETVDLATTPYDPSDTNGYNTDNVVMVLRGTSWQPAWFTLQQLTVQNATGATTKARFVYGVDTTGNPQSTLYIAGTDGSLTAGTWVVGGGTPATAFLHTGSTADIACTGTRQLVVWNDGDNDGLVDTGEPQTTVNFNLHNHNGLEPRDNLILDTATFTPAP